MTDNNTTNTTNANNITSYKGKGKGSNPNSLKNLSKITSTEVARERGRKGGLKSGETKKTRKSMRENILAMLSQEIDPSKLEDYGVDTSTLNGDYTIQNAIVSALLREAMQGDSKSIQLMRDTIGEMPTVKTENRTEIITKEDVETMDNLRKYLTG
jgi:hypothetical protein